MVIILITTKSIIYLAITQLITITISLFILNKIIFIQGITKGIASKDEQEHLESIIFKSGLVFLSQLIIQGPPIVFNYLIDPEAYQSI